jgi:ElaB/YqjD/DUF883 family membrane-anchored ribosome-binding protein
VFNSSEVRTELQALKGDVSRLLNTAGDGILGASRNRADALADQIRATLHEIVDSLGEQEDRIEKLVSGRPIMTLASTFALGLVFGFLLRRH